MLRDDDDDNDALAAAIAVNSHSRLSDRAPPPLAFDWSRLMTFHGREARKQSATRSVLLLGESGVGKRRLLETIDALQALDNDGVPMDEHALAKLVRAEHVPSRSFRLDSSLRVRTVSDDSHMFSFELMFHAQNNTRFSIAQLLANNNYDTLRREFEHWQRVSFFVVMFNVYDLASFYAATMWIDLITAWMGTADDGRKLVHSDGVCRAWLVASTTTRASAATTRAVHRDVAQALALKRNMRYMELDVLSFVQTERLCGEMLSYTAAFSLESSERKRLMVQAQRMYDIGARIAQQRALATTTDSSSSSSSSSSASASSSASTATNRWPFCGLLRTLLCLPSNSPAVDKNTSSTCSKPACSPSTEKNNNNNSNVFLSSNHLLADNMIHSATAPKHSSSTVIL
jgi:hypothetical protein